MPLSYHGLTPEAKGNGPSGAKRLARQKCRASGDVRFSPLRPLRSLRLPPSRPAVAALLLWRSRLSAVASAEVLAVRFVPSRLCGDSCPAATERRPPMLVDRGSAAPIAGRHHGLPLRRVSRNLRNLRMISVSSVCICVHLWLHSDGSACVAAHTAVRPPKDPRRSKLPPASYCTTRERLSLRINAR